MSQQSSFAMKFFRAPPPPRSRCLALKPAIGHGARQQILPLDLLPRGALELAKEKPDETRDGALKKNGFFFLSLSRRARLVGVPGSLVTARARPFFEEEKKTTNLTPRPPFKKQQQTGARGPQTGHPRQEDVPAAPRPGAPAEEREGGVVAGGELDAFFFFELFELLFSSDDV